MYCFKQIENPDYLIIKLRMITINNTLLPIRLNAHNLSVHVYCHFSLAFLKSSTVSVRDIRVWRIECPLSVSVPIACILSIGR